jgi:hypothetical protein
MPWPCSERRWPKRRKWTKHKVVFDFSSQKGCMSLFSWSRCVGRGNDLERDYESVRGSIRPEKECGDTSLDPGPECSVDSVHHEPAIGRRVALCNQTPALFYAVVLVPAISPSLSASASRPKVLLAESVCSVESCSKGLQSVCFPSFLPLPVLSKFHP